VPVRAQRYRTGDTERRLRTASASGDTGAGPDVAWILLASAIALALGIISLLLMR
jgi:hypothetical protein